MRQSNIYEKEARDKFLAQFGGSKIGITKRDGSVTSLHSDLVKIPFWRSNKPVNLKDISKRVPLDYLNDKHKDLGPSRIPRLSSRPSERSYKVTSDNSIVTIAANMNYFDILDDVIDNEEESISVLEHKVIPECAEPERIDRKESVEDKFIEAVKASSDWGPERLLELAKIVEGVLPFDKITFYPNSQDSRYDFNLKKYDVQSSHIFIPKLPEPKSQTVVTKQTKPQAPPRIKAKPPLPKRKPQSYSEMLNLPKTPTPIRPLAPAPFTRPQSVTTSIANSSYHMYTPIHHEIETQTDSAFELDLISQETPPESFGRPELTISKYQEYDIISQSDQSAFYQRPKSSISTKSQRHKPAYFPPIVKLGGLGPAMDSESNVERYERKMRQKVYAERVRKLIPRVEPKPIKNERDKSVEIALENRKKMKEYAAKLRKPRTVAPKTKEPKISLPPIDKQSQLAKLQLEHENDLLMVAEIRKSFRMASSTTLLKYDNPLIISNTDTKDGKAKKQGLKQPSPTEDILNTILPPREWTESGQLWVQKVSHTPATRLDVISLQEQLDHILMKRQAKETGIDPVRRELYSECFGKATKLDTDELIRQVTITCQERGLLLLRVRDEINMSIAAYQTLYESSIAFGMRKAIQAEEGKTETEQRIKDLEEEKVGLEQLVAELKAKAEATEKREVEKRAAEERKHAEEIAFLKRTNAQLKTQLEGILAPKK